MRLYPIGRSLVVQVKAPEKKGFLLISRDPNDPMQAVVKCIGDKVEAPIKEGDLVLVAPYGGSKVAGGSEDEPYYLIAEKEVLGILRDE